MKKIFIAIVLLTGIAIQSKSQDYTVIAKEYCDCYKKLKDTMDVEFRELLIRVARQTDIKAAFAKEMNSLDATKQKMLADQLEALGSSMDSENTEAGRCGIALDKKYEKYIETAEKEKDFTIKMTTELKKNKSCEFLWAVSVFAMAFSDDED
ncbi:MAG TPA: hypothetical protein VGQ04_19590 [Chitinophagaceae bacterium]|jgi:hypothetical protein|nr:hypothetical protein [Chitinophagaceae bacterium]